MKTLSRILLITSLLALIPLGWVAAQNYQWINNLNVNDDQTYVEIRDMAIKSNGSVVVAGAFDGDMVFQGTTYTSTSFETAFLAQYSADGLEEWIRVVEGDPGEYLSAIKVDANDNIACLLSVNDVMFYQGIQVVDENGGELLMKLDPNGNLIWHRVLSYDLANIEATDIAFSSTGDVYLSAECDRSFTYAGFTFGAIGSPYTNRPAEPFVIKYNEQGSVEWLVQGKGQWDEEAFTGEKTFQLSVDSEDNLIMAGSYIANNTNEFGLSFGGLPFMGGNRNDDGVFVVKIRPDGSVVWQKQIAEATNAVSEQERLQKLLVDGTDILLAINFSDDIEIDGTTFNHPHDTDDFPYRGNIIVKLNGNGDLVWGQEVSGGEFRLNLEINKTEGYILSGVFGYTFSSVDHDITFQSTGDTFSDDDGRGDYFVATLDNNGVFQKFVRTYSERGVIRSTYPMVTNSTGDLFHIANFQVGPVSLGSFDFDLNRGPSFLARMTPPGLFNVSLGPDVGQCQGTVTLDAGVDNATYLWSTGETTRTIDISTTGSYAVEVTNQDGDMDSDTVNVTIDQPVTFDFPTQITALLEITLTVPVDGLAYQWSTGETTQSITVNTSGDYSVIVRTANGCETTKTVNVTIQGLDIFKGGNGDGYSAIAVIDDKDFYDGGEGSGYDEFSIVDMNNFYPGGVGDGYNQKGIENAGGFYIGGIGIGYDQLLLADNDNFYSSGIGDGQDLTVTEGGPGFYQGGIGDGYTLAEEVEIIVGLIDDGEIDNLISIYPNPARDKFQIELGAISNKAMGLQILDAKGNIVLTERFDQYDVASFKAINISSFRPGIYLIVIATSDKKFYGKLVKR
ncbi:MAG: T9SS type A sorting domain-containing protein [Bacteroidota bacterium]